THFIIGTTPTGSATRAERMRITSDGYVGIGTTTPSFKLTVVGDMSVTGTLRVGNSADAGTAGYILSSNGSSLAPTWISTSTLGLTGSDLGGFTAGSVVFASSTGKLTQNNSNFFWDNTNNRLGIGTSTPSATFQIASNAETEFLASGDSNFNFYSEGSTMLRVDSDGDGTEYFDFSGGSGTSLMRILESGYVGIGTSTPAVKLVVMGGQSFFGTNANDLGLGTGPAFVSKASGSASGKEFLGAFYKNNTSKTGVVFSSSDSAAYIQSTWGTGANVDLILGGINSSGVYQDTLTLTDTGYVGIGTSTPAALLSFPVGTAATSGINFGGDVNLYRTGTDALKTDDYFTVGGTFYGNLGAVISGGVLYADTGVGPSSAGVNSYGMYTAYNGANDGSKITVGNISGAGNRNLILTDQANYSTKHGHTALSANPTLFIHSAIVSSTAQNYQWGSFAYNTTTFQGFYTQVGSGGLLWGNSTTNWMVLDSSGMLGVGTTTPAVAGLTVQGNIVDYGARGSNANDYVCIDTNGQLSSKATACTGSSARDLKNNIRDLEDVSIEAILALQPRLYTRISNGAEEVGLIADEVSPLIPRMAAYDATGKLYGVEYSQLPIYLLKVVKEQQKIIDGLKISSDIAGNYPLDEQCAARGDCPEVGDVVCVATSSFSATAVVKCTATSTDSILGVISAGTGLVLSGSNATGTVSSTVISTSTPVSSRPLALAGRVPVKVSTANGVIKAGDYLTSSEVPGVAIKTKEPGRVVGMALQDFGDTANMEIQIGTTSVQVNPHWTIGALDGTDIGEDLPDFSVQTVLDKFTLAVKNSLRKLGLVIKDGMVKIAELTAGRVNTDQLCVGATCLDEAQLIDVLQKAGVTPTPAPPAPTEASGATEPPVVEPAPTEASEPPATEPPATEPVVTEPPATEPPPAPTEASGATEPPVVEPAPTEASEPPATEPPPAEAPATEESVGVVVE
ncbi:MAG: tail fiber domain-containing protein, partial [Patescibacteria group bacterium]|nr:tail fiber domain-containing protein [Patescibacteria group bacterium]